jgi:hypothetical protein
MIKGIAGELCEHSLATRAHETIVDSPQSLSGSPQCLGVDECQNDSYDGAIAPING